MKKKFDLFLNGLPYCERMQFENLIHDSDQGILKGEVSMYQ